MHAQGRWTNRHSVAHNVASYRGRFEQYQCGKLSAKSHYKHFDRSAESSTECWCVGCWWLSRRITSDDTQLIKCRPELNNRSYMYNRAKPFTVNKICSKEEDWQPTRNAFIRWNLLTLTFDSGSLLLHCTRMDAQMFALARGSYQRMR